MTMKSREYKEIPEGCPVEATYDIIGGKYKGLILYHLLDETLRFGQVRALMPDVSQRIVTRQLRELEAAGVVRRKVYPVVPPHTEYSLTPLGRQLEPVLRAMFAWGRLYMSALSRQDTPAGRSAPEA
jgi:DNA-binding HxlR family transcriptional regulator